MILNVPIEIGGKRYTKKVKVTLKQASPQFLHIQAPYDVALQKEIKESMNAQWKPDTKEWHLPDNERTAYTLDYLQGKRNERLYDRELVLSWAALFDNQFPELFKHQKENLAFILARRRCLIADTMGLGKTLTCIRAIEYLGHSADIDDWWLVAPPGAQRAWQREQAKWSGRPLFTEITSFESLRKIMEKADGPPQGVVFDEIIKIKNGASQRGQVAAELCRLIREKYGEAGFIIMLSGSPTDVPLDWWHPIECLCPGFIREGGVHKFRNRLANIVYEDGPYGKYPKVESWRDEEVANLGKRLAPIVIRHNKEDVFDFPAKIYEVIQCEPSEDQRQLASILMREGNALHKLRELSDGFQYTRCDEGGYEGTETESAERCDVLHTSNGSQSERGEYESEFDRVVEGGRLHELREEEEEYPQTQAPRTTTYVGSGKLDVVRELLDFYSLENGGPGRLVIYGVFHATLDLIATTVRDSGWMAYTIDGRGWSNPTTLEDFDTEDELTHQGLCIVANPACVHGLSFQKTEAIIYYSNSFVADHRTQSVDRRDRPGMDTNISTKVIDLHCLPTDEYVQSIAEGKMKLEDITMEMISKCLG